MNILNLNLPRCHFHTLIELARSGHNVYTNYESAYGYESSLGIKALTKEENKRIMRLHNPIEIPIEEVVVRKERERKIHTLAFIGQLIDKYNIDILQVCIPNLSYLHTHFKDKIKYIGPPEEVSLLETNKLYAKNIAKQLNIKVPGIIKHGKYLEEDYCKDLPLPCIEKPSHHWSPAIVINNEEEVKELKKSAEIRDWPRHINSDYYIEEYLHDMIETNVFFVISNGKYAITHTQEIIGEGLNKTVNSRVWYFDTYVKPLSPYIDTIVRHEAKKYLEHIAKMGGSWEGSFCGAYTSKGEWYFLETNVRPDIFNSTPIFMTGEEYLKGMFEDVSLFEKAWQDKNCQKLLIISNAENEYPIHLHDKYNVAYPNNLVINDNKYFISNYGVGKISDRGTVISDHNIPKEFIKEVEETTLWKFNEEPNL
jgi:hypothetical protein